MAKQKKYGNCVICGEYKELPAKGMCWKHYTRQRRHNSTDDPEYVNKGKKCKVVGCVEDSKNSGYCLKHYRRVWKHGSPDVVLHGSQTHPISNTFDKDKCIVHQCKEQVSSKELCYKHYHNYMYHKREENIEDIFDYLRLREANPLGVDNE